jgi:probable rRNA maturation factor
MNPVIDILVKDSDWLAAFPEHEEHITRAIIHALNILGATKPYELSIVLTGDAEIQELNKKWRGKDKPTNVLSFPQDEETLLGDIILSLQTIQAEATAQAKPFGDHLSHLTVHGLLHLLGYDHEEDSEAEEMEGLEIEICEGMGIKNPYAEDDKPGKIVA